MKAVKKDKKDDYLEKHHFTKYYQTSTGKILSVFLIFAVIVVTFVLLTGQIAYANVYGPLFNDSKVPKVEFQGSPYAMNATNGSSILVMNVTDLDGPNQAMITEIELTNSSGTIILVSQNISTDVFSIVDAVYHYHTDVKVSPYNGIYIPLGDEATIHMDLTSSLHMELHGKYTVTLVVPSQKAPFATADVTF
ncbi:TQO small subunit DoxA domain-containing protein [Ferroplasma sp.]|uniref:TQO small subunit DoxA domain-containing protein n=1 Tax=Ferroplasma sp. TaxID=2591003 RepID=UPI00307D653A